MQDWNVTYQNRRAGKWKDQRPQCISYSIHLLCSRHQTAKKFHQEKPFVTYLYVHYVIFLPLVVHMLIKLLNTFGNWLIRGRI